MKKFETKDGMLQEIVETNEIVITKESISEEITKCKECGHELKKDKSDRIFDISNEIDNTLKNLEGHIQELDKNINLVGSDESKDLLNNFVKSFDISMNYIKRIHDMKTHMPKPWLNE